MLQELFIVVFFLWRFPDKTRPWLLRIFFSAPAASLIAEDPPVMHANDPFRRFSHFFGMRDQNNGQPLPVKSLEDLQDLRPRPGIKIPRRFVGEDHKRPVHKRPRDRHTLLLPAGKLVGTMSDPVGKPDLLQHLFRPFEVASTVLGVKQGKTNILESGRTRHKIELLEDEADDAISQESIFFFL